jgi:hypothetical protein
LGFGAIAAASVIFVFLREQLIELVLVVVIAEIFVQIVARLHHWNQVLLRAFRADGLINLQRGRVHRAIGRAAIQHDIDARRSQFGGREQRRLAELRDVGQNGDLDRVLEFPVHRQLGHGFRKNHVGPAST